MLGSLKEKIESNRVKESEHELDIKTYPIDTLSIICQHSRVLNNTAYNNLLSSNIGIAKKLDFKNIIRAKLSQKRQQYKKCDDNQTPLERFKHKLELPTGSFDLKTRRETGLDISYLLRYDTKTVLEYLSAHLDEKHQKCESLEELLTPIGSGSKEDFLACVSNLYALLPNSFMIVAPFQDQAHETYQIASVALKLVNHLNTKTHKLLAIHNFVNASKKTAHDQLTIQKDFEYRKELRDHKNTWSCKNKLEYDQIQDFVTAKRLMQNLLSVVYLPNERIGIVSHDPWMFNQEELMDVSKHLTGNSNPHIVNETVTEIYNCISPAGFEVAGNIVTDKTESIKDILQKWLVKYYQIRKLESSLDSNNLAVTNTSLQELRLKITIFCKLFGIEYLPISSQEASKPLSLVNFAKSVFEFNSTLYFSNYYQNITKVLPPTNDILSS